jgi:hypothetical protein
MVSSNSKSTSSSKGTATAKEAGDFIIQGVVGTFSALNEFILEQIEGKTVYTNDVNTNPLIATTETATFSTKDDSKKNNHMVRSPRTRVEAKNREDTNAEQRSQSPTNRDSQDAVSQTKRSSSGGRQGESRDQPQQHLSPARVAMAGERKKTESSPRKRVTEQNKKSGHRGTRKSPASSRQSLFTKKVPIDPKYRHSKLPETEVRGRSESRILASPNKTRRKAVRTPSPTKRSHRRSVSRTRPRKKTEVESRDMPETKKADREKTRQVKAQPQQAVSPKRKVNPDKKRQKETNSKRKDGKSTTIDLKKKAMSPVDSKKKKATKQMSETQVSQLKDQQIKAHALSQAKSEKKDQDSQAVIVLVPDHLKGELSLADGETNVSWMMSMLPWSVGSESQFLQRAEKKEPWMRAMDLKEEESLPSPTVDRYRE